MKTYSTRFKLGQKGLAAGIKPAQRLRLLQSCIKVALECPASLVRRGHPKDGGRLSDRFPNRWALMVMSGIDGDRIFVMVDRGVVSYHWAPEGFTAHCADDGRYATGCLARLCH